MIRPGDNAEGGFVLVETVVAFLILAIALAVGIEAIAQGGGTTRRADEIALASVVARELGATRVPGIAGEGVWTGTHPNGGVWRLAARALPDDGVRPLYAVTIEVRPPGARGIYGYRSFASGAPEP
jgi:general secretion pathway protein I